MGVATTVQVVLSCVRKQAEPVIGSHPEQCSYMISRARAVFVPTWSLEPDQCSYMVSRAQSSVPTWSLKSSGVPIWSLPQFLTPGSCSDFPQ